MSPSQAAAIDAAELPLTDRPTSGAWSENYCNQAYCPEAGVGFWTHLSRLAGPIDLWRDVFVAYLPGDRFLVAKGYGKAPTEAGPGAGMLTLRCDESWRRWTMRFQGGVRDVTGSELLQGALVDQHHRLATMELVWEAMSPVWDLGERMAKQTWAQAHYEQACRVSGRLELEDESWELEGTGIRDHSRGERVFGTVRDHWWLNGQFPSGRSFAVLQVINHDQEGAPLSHAYVSDGQDIERADVEAIELQSGTASESPERFLIRLRTSFGEHTIEGRVLQAMPFVMGSPNELILGAAHGPSDPLALSEYQTEYRWGKEIGYGLTERSRTLSSTATDSAQWQSSEVLS